MNITLLGYGKMGRMIAELASQNHNIVSIIDRSDSSATHAIICPDALRDSDIVLDFSHPDHALDNLRSVAKLGVSVVLGTTGWYERLEEARDIVAKTGIGCLYSGNFSIGVYLFLRLAERAAGLFNFFEGYDVFAHEIHHRQKADSPSATGLTLANAVLKSFSRKTSVLADVSRGKIDPRALHLSSTRGGFVPGTHELFFDSEEDTVEIRHTARSRAGFASGAIRGAEWLNGKQGFFSMDDFMQGFINL